MTFQTTNPFTNEIIKTFQYDSYEHALAKVDRASKDQKKWARLSIAERYLLLKKVADKFVIREPQLAVQICIEMGKPIRQAQDEIRKCVTTLLEIEEVAEKVITRSRYSAHFSQVDVKPEAYGLVLSVQPWNFPFWQVVRMAVGALVTGNLVLLKHSDIVAGCAEMIEDLFTIQDLKLVTNLVLTHEHTANMIANPNINMLTFTGSTHGGSILASQAGRYLKKSILELGGSDAYIVLDDAEIETAVSLILKSRTINSGQSCICAKRVFVHESLSSVFKNVFLEKMNLLKVGDPSEFETDIGPLANSKFVDLIKKQIVEAETIGGVFHQSSFLHYDKHNFSPMGLIDFGNDLEAFQSKEIFGPVLGFYTYKDLDLVLDVISSGPFGLGGGIFSKDLKRAQNLAEKFNAGTVVINNFVQTGVKVPFGGRRNSGYGYELGMQGLHEFINWKVLAL